MELDFDLDVRYVELEPMELEDKDFPRLVSCSGKFNCLKAVIIKGSSPTCHCNQAEGADHILWHGVSQLKCLSTWLV